MAGLTFQLMTIVGQGAIANNGSISSDYELWHSYDDNALIGTLDKNVSKFPAAIQSKIVTVNKFIVFETSGAKRTVQVSMFAPSAGELISGYALDGFGSDHRQAYLFYQGCSFGDSRLKLGYIYRLRTSLEDSGYYITRIFNTNAEQYGWARYAFNDPYLDLNDVKQIACFCF